MRRTLTVSRWFAMNLRVFRKEAGLTQEGLAEAAEINLVTVQALERAAYKPSFEMIVNLSNALGIEPAKLFEKRRWEPGRRGRPRTR